MAKKKFIIVGKRVITETTETSTNSDLRTILTKAHAKRKKAEKLAKDEYEKIKTIVSNEDKNEKQLADKVFFEEDENPEVHEDPSIVMVQPAKVIQNETDVWEQMREVKHNKDDNLAMADMLFGKNTMQKLFNFVPPMRLVTKEEKQEREEKEQNLYQASAATKLSERSNRILKKNPEYKNSHLTRVEKLSNRKKVLTRSEITQIMLKYGSYCISELKRIRDGNLAKKVDNPTITEISNSRRQCLYQMDEVPEFGDIYEMKEPEKEAGENEMRSDGEKMEGDEEDPDYFDGIEVVYEDEELTGKELLDLQREIDAQRFVGPEKAMEDDAISVEMIQDQMFVDSDDDSIDEDENNEDEVAKISEKEEREKGENIRKFSAKEIEGVVVKDREVRLYEMSESGICKASVAGIAYSCTMNPSTCHINPRDIEKSSYVITGENIGIRRTAGQSFRLRYAKGDPEVKMTREESINAAFVMRVDPDGSPRGRIGEIIRMIKERIPNWRKMHSEELETEVRRMRSNPVKVYVADRAMSYINATTLGALSSASGFGYVFQTEDDFDEFKMTSKQKCIEAIYRECFRKNLKTSDFIRAVREARLGKERLETEEGHDDTPGCILLKTINTGMGCKSVRLDDEFTIYTYNNNGDTRWGYKTLLNFEGRPVKFPYSMTPVTESMTSTTKGVVLTHQYGELIQMVIHVKNAKECLEMYRMAVLMWGLGDEMIEGARITEMFDTPFELARTKVAVKLMAKKLDGRPGIVNGQASTSNSDERIFINSKDPLINPLGQEAKVYNNILEVGSRERNDQVAMLRMRPIKEQDLPASFVKPEIMLGERTIANYLKACENNLLYYGSEIITRAMKNKDWSFIGFNQLGRFRPLNTTSADIEAARARVKSFPSIGRYLLYGAFLREKISDIVHEKTIKETSSIEEIVFDDGYFTSGRETRFINRGETVECIYMNHYGQRVTSKIRTKNAPRENVLLQDGKISVTEQKKYTEITVAVGFGKKGEEAKRIVSNQKMADDFAKAEGSAVKKTITKIKEQRGVKFTGNFC